MCKGLYDDGRPAYLVAVKTLKEVTGSHTAPDQQGGSVARDDLLHEAALMAQFVHVNVIRLVGVVTLGEPVMMVLEYAGSTRRPPPLHPHGTHHMAWHTPRGLGHTMMIGYSLDVHTSTIHALHFIHCINTYNLITHSNHIHRTQTDFIYAYFSFILYVKTRTHTICSQFIQTHTYAWIYLQYI